MPLPPRLRPLLIVLALIAGIGLPTAPAWGVTRTVTVCAEAGAGTLRQAMTDAASGDTITFALGGSCTFVLLSPLPTFNGSLTITGPGTTNLTIDGNDSVQIMNFTGGTSDIAISGIRFINGRAAALGATMRGGIISTDVRSLTISNCIFQSAVGIGTGAAPSVEGVAISMEVTADSSITGSTFNLNAASTAENAGVAEAGAVRLRSSGGTVTIASSSFTYNSAIATGTAGSALGGAIRASTVNPLVVSNTTFDNNSVTATVASGSASGGALYVEDGLTSSDSTYTNNLATGVVANGGVVRMDFSPATFAGDTFLANLVNSTGGDAHGGAVYGAGGSVTVSGTTTWTSNQVMAGPEFFAVGGALDVANAPLTITGSATFTTNGAFGSAGTSTTGGGSAWGGAIFASNNASISGSPVFTGNSATAGDLAAGLSVNSKEAGSAIGGAIAVLETGSRSLTVSGATFTHNIATGGSASSVINHSLTGVGPGAGFGGAVYVRVSQYTISSSSFETNSATAPAPSWAFSTMPGGGAIAAESPSGSITSSLFRANTVAPTGANISLGGSIYSHGTGTITTVTNSTITAGQAYYGAGVYALAPSVIHLRGVTLSGNTGTTGGGSWSGASGGTIVNSILSSNTGGNCAGTSLPTTSSSVIDAGTCGADGGGNVTGDPLLSALAANGGPTRTMALQAGSPALLVADSAVCQASPMSGVDQRGVSRPAGRCDMGAYQRSGALTPSGGGTPEPSATPTPTATPTATPSPSATASAPACRVSGVTAVRGNGSVRVTWRLVGTGCTSTATATPVTRAGTPAPVSCTSTGTGCVITGLVPGVRYAISVRTQGATGSADAATAESMVTAVRYVKSFTVVPFAAASDHVAKPERATVRTALRGEVVSALIVGYADPGSWRRERLAASRAAAVHRIVEQVRPALRVPARAGAARNPRCAEVADRCAVLRVTKAVTR